jgi:NAD(P)-dependent dehydrogenase (short-subunit alcohol dehydrogenase family)
MSGANASAIARTHHEMKNKVVVITGATSGIGEVAAENLARMGARIVMVARNPQRAEASLSRLRQIGPGVDHRVHFADLSKLADMRRVAAEIATAEPKIDVLINNAGAMFTRRQVSADGFEMTFATNHLSYFVVTDALLKPLQAAGRARIINTASEAHRGARIDFDDLQFNKDYSGFTAYRRSKLCNILFTKELAGRLKGTGITANSLHPGFVASRFADNNRGLLAYLFRFAKLFAISPEKGAETIVFLASSNEVANMSGLYFQKCRSAAPSKEAQDQETARRLWIETEKLQQTR